jgi:hypothetical protein
MILKKITLYEINDSGYSLTFYFDKERSLNVPIERGISIKDVVKILLDIVRSMIYFIEEKKA